MNSFRKYSLYYTSFKRRAILRDCFWVSFALLSALFAYEQWWENDQLTKELRHKTEVAERHAAQLTGCLNGSYTGLYYYKGDVRVDVVCDVAYEVKENRT